MAKKLLKWSEMFPEGRQIFYEGNNPKEFAKKIKQRFGFDPSSKNPRWNKACGYSFFCPSEHLDEIYGSGRYETLNQQRHWLGS